MQSCRKPSSTWRISPQAPGNSPQVPARHRSDWSIDFVNASSLISFIMSISDGELLACSSPSVSLGRLLAVDTGERLLFTFTEACFYIVWDLSVWWTRKTFRQWTNPKQTQLSYTSLHSTQSWSSKIHSTLTEDPEACSYIVVICQSGKDAKHTTID